MSDPVSQLNRATAEKGMTIRVEDLGPVGQVTLRGTLSDPALAAAVESVAGVGVPEPLGVTMSADETGAVWMSPDELLILVRYSEAGATVAALEEALAGRHHLAVDVSDARAVIELTGARVPEVLAKGAPLDFSEPGFPVGRARRTHLAEIAVGIWRIEPETWQVVCFRSYAGHLFDWLATAAVESAEVDFF